MSRLVGRYCKGKVARRLAGEFVHGAERRRVSVREETDYLSHGPGIRGDEVAGGTGVRASVRDRVRRRGPMKRGERGFAEGKGVESKNKCCSNH
jgi:hypothetical protein